MECQKNQKIPKFCICKFHGSIYRKLKTMFKIRVHFILRRNLLFKMKEHGSLCLIVTEKSTEVTLKFSVFYHNSFSMRQKKN